MPGQSQINSYAFAIYDQKSHNPRTVPIRQPKVILDIAFLGHAHDERTARRGAQRVAGKIFEGLRATAKCDLTYTASAHLAGAYEFLQSQSIDPQQRLAYDPAQLDRSRRGRNVVRAIQRNITNRSLLARARRRLLASRATRLLRGEQDFNPAWLDQADIFHSPHTPFPRAVREHPRIKKFLTLHDFIPLTNPEYFVWPAKPFMDGVLACLTPENFAFCVSETTRNDALNYSRIPPENVFVTPLAADEKLFQPVTDAAQLAAVRAQFKIPDAPYFLAVSAHDRHKNFPHLIRCFGTLVDSGELPEANLVIVGPNPSHSAEVIAALAAHPRARARVIIAGFVPDENLAALYSGAVAFLFPSLAEGFGIPPLEAMQCGTPVIASNTTSIPEVVGDAGILLPPTDEDAWCQNILRLARDEKLRGELRAKSLVRCKLFSWPRFTEAILRGYEFSLAAR